MGNWGFQLRLAALGGPAFALTELGVPQSDDLTNTQAYVASWLAAMANDPAYIFRAATQANKAVDFLLSFSRTPEPEAAIAE